MARPPTHDVEAQLRVLAWELTRRCNLACAHCRALAQGEVSPDELSLSEIGKVLEQVAALPRPLLILSGGEPLLREDLLDIVALARSTTSRWCWPPMAPSSTASAPARSGRRESGG
jgi:MoaA/NifB/PqqE/SkfB family radical SAM enzyme